MLRFFIMLMTLAGLTACEPHITNANLREVKAEMTMKEVETVLGQPTTIESITEPTHPEPKNVTVTRYHYQQSGKTVTLTFKGDRLAPEGIQGSFDK
jgi:hypothetical protein